MLRFSARAVRGIEDVVAAEVAATGGSVVRLAHREVVFDGPSVDRFTALGTADDAFLVLIDGPPVGPHRSNLVSLPPALDLSAAARLLGRRGRSFDVTASFLGRRSYSRFDVEDELGRRLAAVTGWRYAARRAGDPGATTLSLRVHLTEERTTVAARLGRRPLHRRPYRVVSRPVALHPPLARALVALADAPLGATLVDPFCGTGTIAIEAKLARPDLQVTASDVEPAAVAAARANARAASVALRVAARDARAVPPAEHVVANPPWGRSASLRGGPVDLARLVAPGGRMVLLTTDAVPPGRELEVVEHRRVRVAGRLASIWVMYRRAVP
jgi:SAM-dependent methyltransferase